MSDDEQRDEKLAARRNLRIKPLFVFPMETDPNGK